MPSSPLQHLLKLLQVVTDQGSDGSLNIIHPKSPPFHQSFGDGIHFLEEFKKRQAGPIARSTPNTSPTKHQYKREDTKITDRRLSFSMPDLHKLSPIKEKLDKGNATGPNGSSEPRRRKIRFNL